MDMSEKKLKSSVLNLSGFGDFGFTLFVNVELYYWAAFLTDYARFSVATATFILTITSVIDCIWVPITGWLIEKSNFKWGKYRSWLVIGPPIMIFTYALEFSRIGSSEMLAAGIVIAAFSIKTLAQDLAYSASVSLVSDLSNVQEERMTLAARRGQFLSLGNIVFSVIALPLITWLAKASGNEILGYSLAAIIFGILNFICYYVAFSVTRGCSVSGSGGRGESGAPAQKLNFSQMLKAVFANPPLFVLIVADSFRYLAYFLMSAAAYYYFVVVLGDLAAMTTYLVVTRVIGFIGSSFANMTAKKLGKKTAYLGSLVIMILSLVLCFFFGRTVWTFIFFHIFVNFFQQITMSTLTALLADTVIYYQWKTSVDARGFIMSMLNVPIKVGAILRSTILGAGLAMAGYVANSAPTAAQVRGISMLMNLYPAVFLVFTVVIFGIGYRLNESKIESMTGEIAARRQA